MRYQSLIALALTMLAAAGCGPGADPVASSTSPGHTEELRYTNSAGSYRGLVYVPTDYDPEQQLPLFVMVHGCNTTAEEQQAANMIDELADQERFLVLYPDHDTEATPGAGTHPAQCWRFYDPLEWQRDSGDPDGIVGLTRQVIDRWSIDLDRVYLAGMSSGALETSVLGATYPDLFAVMAIVAGGPYESGLQDVFNPVVPTVEPVAIKAQHAYEAMGAHARVVPFIEMHGSIDFTVPPRNGVNAVQQWLMTNNLVVSGTRNAPYPLSPSFTTQATVPGGYDYEVDVYQDALGCTVGEHVRILGMDHFWPGGSESPESAPFTDPRAPSGAVLAWTFFKRYSMSHLPCDGR